MAGTVMVKKGIEMALSAFLKAAGTEAGKKIVNRDKAVTQEKRRFSITDIRESVGIMSKKYNWEDIDNNVNKSMRYVKKIVPIVGATGLAYVTVPVFVGASTAVMFGAEISAMSYTIANGAILAGGAYKVADTVFDISKGKEVPCDKAEQVDENEETKEQEYNGEEQLKEPNT